MVLLWYERIEYNAGGDDSHGQAAAAAPGQTTAHGPFEQNGKTIESYIIYHYYNDNNI